MTTFYFSVRPVSAFLFPLAALFDFLLRHPFLLEAFSALFLLGGE